MMPLFKRFPPPTGREALRNWRSRMRHIVERTEERFGLSLSEDDVLNFMVMTQTRKLGYSGRSFRVILPNGRSAEILVWRNTPSTVIDRLYPVDACPYREARADIVVSHDGGEYRNASGVWSKKTSQRFRGSRCGHSWQPVHGDKLILALEAKAVLSDG
jgi:hypothetical protein